MGDFAATCAVTRLSIMEGEPVFYVRTKRQTDTYDLLGDVNRYIGEQESGFTFTTKPWEYAGFGTYSGYGGINEYAAAHQYEHGLQFFIHQRVALEILSRNLYVVVEKAHPEWSEERHLAEKLKIILTFCMSARIQVMGHELVGPQYREDFELDEQGWLLELIVSEHERICIEYDNNREDLGEDPDFVEDEGEDEEEEDDFWQVLEGYTDEDLPF